MNASPTSPRSGGASPALIVLVAGTLITATFTTSLTLILFTFPGAF